MAPVKGSRSLLAQICGLGSWSPRSVTQQLFDFDRKSARSFYVGGPSVPRPVLRRLDRFRASARDHTIVCVAILTIEPNRDYAIKEFGVILDKASDVKKRDTPVRSEEHTSELQSRLHLVCRL